MSADLQTMLFEAMLACDASPSLARIRSTEWAAVMLPEIEREKREQEIDDLFYKMPRQALAEKYGLHRATIYRMHKKLSRQNVERATKCA